MRMRLVMVGILVLGLGTLSAEAAPIFINGNFEATGPFPGWFTSMTAVNTPGWTIGAASVFPIIASNTGCGGSYGAGNDGCNFGVLGGGETGGGGFISQSIAGFVVGNPYILSWLQSSEYLASDIVNAQIIGAATLSQNFVAPPSTLIAGGPLWSNWQSQAFPFVADATSLTFRFSGFGNLPFPTNYDPGVDAFRLADANAAAVPEPVSILLVGSGLAGLAMRRRQRKNTTI